MRKEVPWVDGHTSLLRVSCATGSGCGVEVATVPLDAFFHDPLLKSTYIFHSPLLFVSVGSFIS